MPHVSAVEASGTVGAMTPDETLMTPEGRDDLERELQELVDEKRPELAKRIKAARELGDLKENAEYHAAKEEQAFLETRIKRIEDRLRTAKVIEAPSGEVVTVGTTVVVAYADGDEEKWTITGVDEADPLEQRISYESPIGSALMGSAPGDTVQVNLPAGQQQLTVRSVS